MTKRTSTTKTTTKASRIGYARVSSVSQHTDNQEAKLKAAGCTIIRMEKVSGKSLKGRDELATIIEFLRDGDVLVVTKLDRLGRNTRDVLNLIHEITDKGAHLQVLEPALTTEGEMGKVMITILSMVAEMELNRLKERREEGIAAAKVKGIYRGGVRQTDYAEVKRLVETGLSKAEVARRMGISRETVYQALKG
jgi:DNA invertase Pin-like site-specific DNA recombinase